MADRSVNFKITGDSSDLSSELKKVGQNLDNLSDSVQGVSNDARKAMDGLGKAAGGAEKNLKKVPQGINAAGKGAKPAANNVENFSDRLEGLSENAGESSSIMSGLAGAFGIISPEAQAAATGIADAAGGLEAIARSGPTLVGILGPVAVAVGALGIAYVQLTGELEEANTKLETNRQRLKAVEEMSGKVKEAVLLAALAEAQAAEARGDIDATRARSIQLQVDELAIAQSASDIFGGRKKALEEENQAIKEEIAAKQKAVALENLHNRSVRGSILIGSAAANTRKASAAASTKEAEALQSLQRQLANNERQQSNLTVTEQKYIDAKQRKIAADKESARVTAAASASDKKQTETVKDTTKALDVLEASAAAARMTQLKGREKIEASYMAEMEALQAVADQYVDNAEIQASLAIAQKERSIQFRNEIAEFDRQKDEEKLERARQQDAQILAGMQGLAAASSGMFLNIANVVGEGNKKAARKVFKIYKALAMADVGIKMQQGFAVAASLPPPASALKFAEVMVTTAGAMAAIQATQPAFHTGTGMVRAPSGVSEMNARLRGGEAVSTPLGAEILGRDTIERANAGIGPGSGSGPVVFQYEHRQFSRFIRDSVRMRGPLATESETGRQAGHRRR